MGIQQVNIETIKVRARRGLGGGLAQQAHLKEEVTCLQKPDRWPF